MRVTEWICEDDGYFCYRAIEGTDVTNAMNRVAAVEKIPRVRVSPFFSSMGARWEFGPKGQGGSSEGSTCTELKIYGSYPPSREWCDTRLKELGYELPEEGDSECK